MTIATHRDRERIERNERHALGALPIYAEASALEIVKLKMGKLRLLQYTFLRNDW